MTEFESKLRRGLNYYAQATPVSRPPLDQLLNSPERVPHRLERPRYVLTAAGIAAVATVVLGAALWPGRGEDDNAAVSTTSAPCAPEDAVDGVVGSGQLHDARSWTVQVGGQPPSVVTSTLVDGQGIGGSQSDQVSWAGLVNQGNIYVHFEFYDQGLLVAGEVPKAAASVELQLSGGEPLVMCPVAVPDVDAVNYFAGYLPAQPQVEGLVAFDATGQRVAYLDRPERLYLTGPDSVQPGDDRGVSIDLALDTAHVDLPLGGAEWPAVDPDELTEVITGQLPSGPWSVRAGRDEVDESLIALALELPGRGGFPPLSGTAEQLLAAALWRVDGIDGRLFVSGLTPADVATVVVTLGDGQTVELPTVESGVPGFEGRLFAAPLAEGATIAAMDGRASDGRVLVAVEVDESINTVDDSHGVGYPVQPVP